MTVWDRLGGQRAGDGRTPASRPRTDKTRVWGLSPHGLEGNAEREDQRPARTRGITLLRACGRSVLETGPIGILRNPGENET